MKRKICLYNQISITSHRDTYNPRWRHPMTHKNLCKCQLQSVCIFVQNLSSVGDYLYLCDANTEDPLKITAKLNF